MSHDTFEARALQLAYEMTAHNTYEGKVGQGHNEARAADIRRLFDILCGHDPEDHAHESHKKAGRKASEKAAEKRRKKFADLPPSPKPRRSGGAELAVNRAS